MERRSRRKRPSNEGVVKLWVGLSEKHHSLTALE
jgi:hypothetical protein